MNTSLGEFTKMNIYRASYLIKSFFDFPYHLRKVRWWIHRANHGWAPNDVWSFDMYLAKVISGGLGHLKENNMGYPAFLETDEQLLEESKVVAVTSDARQEEFNANDAKWKAILGQIEHGFSMYIEANDCEDCGYGFAWNRLLYKQDDSDTCKKHTLEDYDKAWDLFRKYFMGLWD